MSLSPKTQERIDRVILALNEAWSQQDKTILLNAIELVLKEQDRDTRHACAEAVLMANPRDAAHEHPLVVECFNRAHQACMNAQAV